MASNAVTALQQVYQLSGNRPGQKGRALQAWAHILLKPELRRVSEACHLLEQVALDTIQQGGNYSQAQSKHCLWLFSHTPGTGTCDLAVAKLEVSIWMF